MEQMTIFDILQQQDTEPEQVGPHDWRPIRSGARIGLTKFMPLVYPVTDHDTSEAAIEYVTFGNVDGTPAAIGFRTWLSNDVEEYEPIQWRPITRR